MKGAGIERGAGFHKRALVGIPALMLGAAAISSAATQFVATGSATIRLWVRLGSGTSMHRGPGCNGKKRHGRFTPRPHSGSWTRR
jgi:hypothetical protein